MEENRENETATGLTWAHVIIFGGIALVFTLFINALAKGVHAPLIVSVTQVLSWAILAAVVVACVMVARPRR